MSATMSDSAGGTRDDRTQATKAMRVLDRLTNWPAGASPRWSAASRSGALYLGLTMIIAGLISGIPLTRDIRFYYMDDTQASAVGIWYEVGRYLVQTGHPPILLPGAFPLGNVLTEGQWSIFNPIFSVINIATFLTGRLILVATLTKIFGLIGAAAGGYLSARAYGATPRWSLVAGTAIPFIGFTMYMDAPSWITGLYVFSGLTWTVWALRRFSIRGGTPLLPFITGYLVITVGYVHGTLMLALTIFAVALEAFVDHRPRAGIRILGVGTLLGLVAAFVYLPGLLSSPVTQRSVSGITNSNFLAPDPSVLFTSFLPTMRPWLLSWSGAGPSPAPLAYLSWLLLLVPLLNWKALTSQWRSWLSLGIVFCGAFALTFGPSEITPLRAPVRLMPYLGLTAILFVVSAASRFRVQLRRRQVIITLVVAALGTYFALAKAPAAVLSITAGSALAVLGMLALSWASLRRPRLVPVAGAAITSSCLAMSMLIMPAPPLADWGFPPSVASFKEIAPGRSGQLFVVGDPRKLADPWSTTTFATGWFLAGVSTGNMYTPVGFKAYQDDLCQDSYGVTCTDSVNRLFALDPATGVPIADLLQVNLVEILDVPDAAPHRAIPAGWRADNSHRGYTLWERITPLPSVGGPAWATPSIRLSSTEVTDLNTSFTVDAVPPTGGDVVLSRLAWPGYTTDAGALTTPARGYLLTLHLTAADIGRTVTVSFAPPAWPIILGLGISSVVCVFIWAVIDGIIGVRRRRR